MTGRAGPGECAGHAVAIAHPNDAQSTSALQRELSEERLPRLTSHFERVTARAPRKTIVYDADTKTVAKHIAARVGRLEGAAARIATVHRGSRFRGLYGTISIFILCANSAQNRKDNVVARDESEQTISPLPPYLYLEWNV
jgi:hypothetical protein